MISLSPSCTQGAREWRLCPSYQARKDRREATETCFSQTRISQHPQTKHIINKINKRERGILKVGWLSSIPLAVRGTSAVSPCVCVCVCVCMCAPSPVRLHALACLHMVPAF